MSETTPSPEAPKPAPASPAPPRRRISDLRVVARFTLRYPLQIGLAILALLVAAGATLYIPYTFKQIVDHGFSAGASRAAIAPQFEQLLVVTSSPKVWWYARTRWSDAALEAE